MENQKLPIIFIPGFGGSQLESRLIVNDFEETNLTKSWETLYLSLKGITDLSSVYKSLTMEPADDFSQMINKNPNILIRPTNFGTLDGVKYLDKTTSKITYIYSYMIKFLKENMGYEKEFNMYGAPYDFRQVSTKTEFNKYCQNLNNLIQTIYLKHQKPCILISHSLGCVLVAKYLTEKCSHWKQKYINSWVSISGVFGGTMLPTKALLCGSVGDFGKAEISNPQFLKAARSFPSFYSILPSCHVFGSDYVVYQSLDKNYTTNEYSQLFKDFGVNDYPYIKRMNFNLLVNSKLGVYTIFIYSLGMKTLEKIVETKSKDEYEEIYGDGDGTVNKVSLEVCTKFSKLDPINTEISIIQNVQHHKILKNKKTFDILQTFIEKRNHEWNKSQKGIYRAYSSFF